MMKLTVSRSSAIAAAFAAVAARTFLFLALDAGPVHNGAWLSALLGALMAVPWLMGLDALCARKRAVLPLYLLPLAATTLDGGLVLSAIVRSAGFLALDRVPSIGLALPVGLAIWWCVCRNGDAVGYGAMLWMRVFPLLLLLVILPQFSRFRPEWLRPVLGNGWQSIVRGGVGVAGSVVPAVAILLLAEESPDHSRRSTHSLWVVSAGAMISALLILLRLMMAPTAIAGDDWPNRLDALLTNGRAPLYLQLPMIALWYAGLLHLLLCECFASAALLQKVFPKVGGRLCGLAASIEAVLLSFSPLPSLMGSAGALPWLFIGSAALAGLYLLLSSGAKGGASKCAE